MTGCVGRKNATMPQHFLLRIGNGNHFISSSTKSIWGINSANKDGWWFIHHVQEGDLLWFVTSNSKGKIIAVATYTGTRERVLGPLLALTSTNEELGWTETEGNWDTEVHYKDLYDLRPFELFSEIKSPLVIRLYSEKCKVDLPTEYKHITRYVRTTSRM
jgi:hypothetical protein